MSGGLDPVTIRMLTQMNSNTESRFRPEWESNWAANWPLVKDRPGLNRLFGGFSGAPGLVVNAGPSLEFDLRAIRGLRGRAFILCVDRAYPKLQEAGVEPDMVITLDPQAVVAGWFSGHARGVPVAACPWQHPETLKRIPLNDLVPYVEFNPDIEFWRDKYERDNAGERFGWLTAGGTVGAVACSGAVALGLNPVMFTGLDLSVEVFIGLDGREACRTLPAFLANARWYEEHYFPQAPEVRFVNCSKTTILKRGVELLPLEDAAKAYALETPRNFRWEIRKRLQGKKRVLNAGQE